MESQAMSVFVLALLSFITAPACSQSLHASQNPLPVGSTVTLSSDSSVSSGAWLFNNDIIVMIFGTNKIISDQWKDRVTFNSTSNHTSLAIRSLQVADSGIYTLQALNLFRVQLQLSVQEPVSNVTLRAQATNLVEFNDTAVLMCSVSNGSSPSYMWLNDSAKVMANGSSVQLKDGGATLMMVGVTRNDMGPFRCNVSNDISYEISAPLSLNISYGPSNAKMTIMPMKHIYRTGSNITLTCSAEFSPTASIQWKFNGVSMNHFTASHHQENVTVSSSGNYQCLFHNPVTSRFATVSISIQVIAPIASVVVNDGGKAAILHKPFTLNCQVMGEVDSIYWFRNGQVLSVNNTSKLVADNRTLYFSPVEHSDEGVYYCQAFNYVSNMTSSSYTLQLNYGPMAPEITMPAMALTGDHKTLNCTSASHPPSFITWHFNNYLVANGSVLAIGPLTLNMSGTYICMAFNNVTNNTSTAYTMLVVYAPVTRASIQIAGGQPILNHTFTLTCETTGSVKSLIWMYNWSPLVEDSTRILSMDNTTLTFSPIVRTDNGNYQCVASNPLSNYTGGFTLEYFYGPEMATIIGPNVVQTGDIVTLSCDALSYPPSNYTWFFNGSSVANMSDFVTPPLTMDMSGIYTCMAYNNITGKDSFAYTRLTVHEEITLVQVVAPAEPAIEGHLYELMCNVTGAAKHVYWMKNGELVHGDNRTSLHMENRTLTFYLLERHDKGSYQCMASNPVWNMTSPYYRLLVNYGPEEPIIYGKTFVENGKIAYFNCSALSFPYSWYSWWFNDTEVANTPWIHIGPLSFNMSGEYTCVAYNNVTMKNSTNSKMLTVIEAIESVMVTNDSVPINHENFTLTCEVTGPSDMLYWVKDGMLLNMSANAYEGKRSYRIENNTLQFTPVTISDDGVYQCAAYNRAGTGKHLSQPYVLLVNYGPLSVNVSGPTSTGLGLIVTLTCSADSRPDGVFHWFFNNRSSFLHAGSVLTMLEFEANDGNYICEVWNPVTNITMYTMKDVTFGHAMPINVPSRGSLLTMAVFALSFMLHN